MNFPLLLEQYATWRQADYQREAAAERLALQASQPSPSLRARLSIWLFELAHWLASDAQPAVHRWELADCRPCANGSNTGLRLDADPCHHRPGLNW